LKNKKIAPARILKIVPATDAVWKICLNQGLLNVFKEEICASVYSMLTLVTEY
jgi:hypothetical protein